MLLPRRSHRAETRALLRQFPIVTLLGARQVGKTTLARQVLRSWRGRKTLFDLEDPEHVARLAEPGLVLRSARGLVVLDEIQRKPDLFPLLRVLADRPRRPATFLLLGSASPDLWRSVTESLAGRVSFHVVDGLGLDEVGPTAADRLWVRGGFPLSFLAKSDDLSLRWRRELVETLLGRDLPALGFSLPAEQLRRLWTMLAHLHGQTPNLSELGAGLGVSHVTVRRWIDVLAGTYAIRTLPPWSGNVGKRMVKSPKVYVADTGVLHALLGIRSKDDLLAHPKVGASWEGFAISQVVRRLGARPDECSHYATHAGAELDLVVARGRKRLGFEVKRTDAPKVTKSMHIALADLALDRLDVIHAGQATFPMGERIRAVALSRLWTDVG
jgi:predicted AAA+ superfamily ATPase